MSVKRIYYKKDFLALIKKHVRNKSDQKMWQKFSEAAEGRHIAFLANLIAEEPKILAKLTENLKKNLKP